MVLPGKYSSREDADNSGNKTVTRRLGKIAQKFSLENWDRFVMLILALSLNGPEEQ